MVLEGDEKSVEAQGLQTGAGAGLVLLGRAAGDTDAADALAVGHDGQATTEQHQPLGLVQADAQQLVVADHAAMRHLMSWWEGEDTDPDSGMSHVTKAITSLVVLRDAMIQGMCTDDRPPRSAEFYARLNTLAAEVLARHADKSPRHYTIADSK